MAPSNTNAILTVEDLRVYFPVRGPLRRVLNRVKAVDGVSLSLEKGETYGLVGETGCGKTTLGRAIVRLLESEGGRITLNGRDITHLPEKDLRPLRREMQMVFQDVSRSLNPRRRVGRILMEALAIHKIGGAAEQKQRAMDILHKVGLQPEHFYRFPHEFSGGQRQRIVLARALMLNPGLVIFDEPVSALDVSIRSQIINLLRDLQEGDHLSFLFIAHDISVVRHISSRIGVMYLGHIVEEADTETLLRNPLHPYTQTLLSAVPAANPRQVKNRIVLQGELPSPIDPPSGCPFHTRCPKAKPECSTQAPDLFETEEGHKTACLLYLG
jgi:peptide/nickel transport system ATP-binding protein/oligopeptide transport system ATP-binding protein